MAATTDANGWRDNDGASDSNSDTAAPGGRADDHHLSPEDAAWVDSCLDKDDDYDVGHLSDESWATLTEAFINALASASGARTAQQDEDEAGESSATGAREASSPANAFGDVLMSEAVTADDSQAAVFEEASSPTASGHAASFCGQPAHTLGDSGATSGDGSPFNNMFAPEEGTGRLDAAAVVTGNEYPDEKGYGDVHGDELFPDLVVDAGQEVNEVELTKDVFRVWDLDVLHEEDEDEHELSWQLKKAVEVGGSSVGATTTTPPRLADEHHSSFLEEGKGDNGNPDSDGRGLDKPIAPFDGQDLEELITGIGDMSLRSSSS